MKLVKKIEIKLTVRDNPFLKEQLSYLQRCCKFSKPVENHDYYTEQAELVALIDSDEFIIALDPVTHRNDELTIDGGEFQYIVRLEFKGTSMSGNFWNSYEPYVLLTPSEVLRLMFPNDDDVDYYIIPILGAVFGLKHYEKFNYEII